MSEPLKLRDKRLARHGFRRVRWLCGDTLNYRSAQIAVRELRKMDKDAVVVREGSDGWHGIYIEADADDRTIGWFNGACRAFLIASAAIAKAEGRS